MAKTGRPKAKVSITFSEEELKTLIIGMESSVFEMSENVFDFNTRGLAAFGREVSMLARLRDVRDRKYGEQ